MAKKDPTDLSVEEKLKTLFQLQSTLSAIDEKRAMRGELPLEVQDLEDEIAGLTIRVEKIQNEMREFQDAIVQKKGEIEKAKASVQRYESQLDLVKNNREYDTLTKEIEFQNLEIELCTKRISEANVRVEERAEDLKHAQEQIEGHVKLYNGFGEVDGTHTVLPDKVSHNNAIDPVPQTPRQGDEHR